ncbi:MAG: type I phosphomannose isomerase catalytic subunit [Planctomycetota bacterium]
MSATDWSRRPLRLSPIPVTRVWGGARIQEQLHPHIGGTSPIGESWEVSDVGENPALHSVVREGPARGRTLRELLYEDAAAILGAEAVARLSGEPRLPLLLKYVDAQQPLSVQVHPSDELVAQLKLPDCGKCEAWVVMDAIPGAWIIYGLEPGRTFPEYLAQAREGRGAEGLHQVPVQRGDVIYLPAGTVHAIGAGVLLAEIQQSSDHTFRIYDWDRVGLDGLPRQIHLEQAAHICPPEPAPPCPLPVPDNYTEGFCSRLESAPFSLSELHSKESSISFPEAAGRFAIFALLEGSAVVEPGFGAELPLRRGDVLFFPAAVETPCRIRSAEEIWGLWMQPA